MHYTIASISDMAGKCTIDLDKSGNQYNISIRTEYGASFKMKYDTRQQAHAVFMRLTEAIITGCYSYEQRCQIMKGVL